MTAFFVKNTHAFPGCRVHAEVTETEGPALVEFSDGAVAGGSFVQLDEGVELLIDSYVTSRGTKIASKSWRLSPFGSANNWKIVSRRT